MSLIDDIIAKICCQENSEDFYSSLNARCPHGDSVYVQTVAAEYPGIRRVRNSPDKILRSENHHAAIIDKAFFDRVQEMRDLRSNVEVDGQGNRVRKSSHYSMKLPRDTVGDPTGSVDD